MVRVTKHLILMRKKKTQPGKYSQPHREAGLEIINLEAVLRPQQNLRGLLKKTKARTWAKGRGTREPRQGRCNRHILRRNNRASLTPCS